MSSDINNAETSAHVRNMLHDSKTQPIQLTDQQKKAIKVSNS